jgi:membrane-bound ClpP family serine protease
MKIVGGFLIFLALYGFQTEVTRSNVSWFALGVFLIAMEEWFVLFGHTVRYIHRDKPNVKK